MHIKIHTQFKSLKPGKEVDLPDFCVLTGKNGSGKSHFLESLVQKNIAEIINEGTIISVDKIKYIKFNGLNPQINPNCSKDDINQKITNFWNPLSQMIRDSNNQNA